MHIWSPSSNKLDSSFVNVISQKHSFCLFSCAMYGLKWISLDTVKTGFELMGVWAEGQTLHPPKRSSWSNKNTEVMRYQNLLNEVLCLAIFSTNPPHFIKIVILVSKLEQFVFGGKNYLSSYSTFGLFSNALRVLIQRYFLLKCVGYISSLIERFVGGTLIINGWSESEWFQLCESCCRWEHHYELYLMTGSGRFSWSLISVHILMLNSEWHWTGTDSDSNFMAVFSLHHTHSS